MAGGVEDLGDDELPPAIGVAVLSWAFGGTHSRVAERTRLFPEGEYSGKCQAIRPI